MAKKAATKSAKPLIAELFGETPAKKPRAKKAAKRKAKASPAEAEQPKVAKSGTKIIKVVKGVPIPAYPPELATKQLGDKTPAVLEWYAKNHPEAHAALVASYGNQ